MRRKNWRSAGSVRFDVAVVSGFFITFEGGEGTGKSTQIARLAEHLRSRGIDVVTTREPGGSEGAEALRHILLSGAAKSFEEADMEAVLFAAARADHVSTLIRPALEEGWIVICDRFHDSTRVYQGLGGTDPALIDLLEEATLDGLRPDLTIVLDVPAEVGLRRAAARRSGGLADRFEIEALSVHEVRRTGFLDLADAEPQRCVVVDGSRPVEEISKEIAFIVEDRLDSRRREGTTGQGRPFTDATR